MAEVYLALLSRLEEAGLSTKRFLRVQCRGKGAIEPGWPDNLHEFYEVAHNGENFGIAAGEGLVLIDADKEPLIGTLQIALPKTFTVRSPGHSSPHFYLKVEGDIGNLTLFDGVGDNRQPNNVGHVQARRKFLVGPCSVHPNGGRYEVIADLPIAIVKAMDLEAVLKPFLLKSLKTSKGLERTESKRLGLGDVDFDIMTIAPPGLQRIAGELSGPHPIHGSETGRNFWINPRENVWHCFRCGSGGGPLSLLAVLEGIIDCSEATPGNFRGDTFKQTIAKARSRGLVEGPVRKDADWKWTMQKPKISFRGDDQRWKIP